MNGLKMCGLPILFSFVDIDGFAKVICLELKYTSALDTKMIGTIIRGNLITG